MDKTKGKNKDKGLYGKSQTPHQQSKKILELAKMFENGNIGEKAMLKELKTKAEEATKEAEDPKLQDMTDDQKKEVSNMNDGAKQILTKMVNDRIYKTRKSFFKRFRKSNLLDALVSKGVVTLNNEKTELMGDLNMEKFRGLGDMDLDLGKSNMGKGLLQTISNGCKSAEEIKQKLKAVVDKSESLKSFEAEENVPQMTQGEYLNKINTILKNRNDMNKYAKEKRNEILGTVNLEMVVDEYHVPENWQILDLKCDTTYWDGKTTIDKKDPEWQKMHNFLKEYDKNLDEKKKILKFDASGKTIKELVYAACELMLLRQVKYQVTGRANEGNAPNLTGVQKKFMEETYPNLYKLDDAFEKELTNRYDKLK